MSILKSVGEQLEKLGVKLQEQTETEKTETKLMAEAKLQDGSIIMSPADEWAVGVEVFVVTEDGSNIPLGEGTYELEGGGTLVVEQEGVVGQLNAGTPEGEQEEAEKTEQASTESQEVKQPKAVVESVVKETKFNAEEKFNEISDKLTELSKSIELINKARNEEGEALEAKFSAAGEGIKALAEQIDELAKPATKLQKHNPEGDSKKSEVTNSDKVLLSANPATLSAKDRARHYQLKYSQIKTKK